jgi:hypothetical protein
MAAWQTSESKNPACFRDRDLRFSVKLRHPQLLGADLASLIAQLDHVDSILRLSCETLEGSISLASLGVAKLIPFSRRAAVVF